MSRCDGHTRRGARCAYTAHVVVEIDGEEHEICRVHHAYYTEWVDLLGRDAANERLLGVVCGVVRI